jgi:hypothetical protein
MPKLIICILITLASTQIVLGQRVRQSREVVEAFRVCRQFQTLMAEDLDFDRAFEATFTKSAARRREIAITEGEFGSLDFSHVNNATLIDAFKSRMQIFYLLLPLASPNNNEEEDLFFPPAIKAIFERKPPASVEDFSAYAVQLKRDVADLRAHLNQLAGRYPRVAERIREFKSDLSKPIELPQHKVKPLTAYSKGKVLGLREEYYQIGDYAVIREAGQMRIVGIRFFSRLF